jgi:hypothetical protein
LTRLLLDAFKFAASSHCSTPCWRQYSTSEVLLVFGKALDAPVARRRLGVIASQHTALASV